MVNEIYEKRHYLLVNTSPEFYFGNEYFILKFVFHNDKFFLKIIFKYNSLKIHSNK